ncbi:MAG: response regulator [bacterium]|nr:response regulator [bacterium]
MRALIIEDDVHSAQLLQKMLDPWTRAEVALSGSEGLVKIETGIAEGTPFELIFLDILMPDLDGREVLTNLRRIEAEADIEEAVVVMATQRDDAESVITSFSQGAHHYFLKPYDQGVLAELLSELGLSRKI